jgi:hypothetical protein
MVFDTKRTTVHEFAENGHASPGEPLVSRRDLGTPKWTPDLAGETSVSA